MDIQEGLSGGYEMFDRHLNPQLTSLPSGSGNLATGNGLFHIFVKSVPYTSLQNSTEWET